MRKRLLLICTIALCACNSGQSKDTNTSDGCLIRIDVDKDIEKNMQSIHDIAYDWSAIELENHDDAILDQIRDFEIVDDKIICFASAEGGKVVVFDINGKYIYHINNRGQGPREWIEITSFFVNKNEKTIILSDGKSNKVLVYNLDGELSQAYNFGSIKLFEVAQNEGVFYSQNTTLSNLFELDDSLSTKVNTYDTDLRLIRKQVPYKRNDFPFVTESHGVFSMNYQNDILCCPIGDEYIYKISGDSILPYIKFNYTGKKSFRTDREWADIVKARGSESGKKGITFYSNTFLETDSLIYRRMGYYEAFDILYNKMTKRVLVTEFDSPYLNTDEISKNILYQSPSVFYKDRFYARFMSFIFDAPSDYMEQFTIPEPLKPFRAKFDEGEFNGIIVTYKLKI